MKKTIQLFSLFIITLISFSACENEPLEGFDLNALNATQNQDSGNFQVDFDGQTFVADQFSATISDEIINITGLRGVNGEFVTLTINGTTTGTYQLGVQSGISVNAAAYTESNTAASGWLASTDGVTSQGQVVITSIDTVNLKISGIFSFTATNFLLNETKIFTNGSFTNITYQDGFSNTNSSNSFFAKIDGVEFVEDGLNGIKTTFLGNSFISISAIKNNGETLSLSVDAAITPGTYNFDGLGSFYNIAQYIGDDPTHIYLGNGSFEITLHDVVNKKIEGTFTHVAEAVDPTQALADKNISEGSFSITYID